MKDRYNVVGDPLAPGEPAGESVPFRAWPMKAKPAFGSPCNHCGYCCTEQPCDLAVELLKCDLGPCVALEWVDGKSACGLVRNPLGYIFKAANPDSDVNPADPAEPGAEWLSAEFASALGVGKGCDSDDPN